MKNKKKERKKNNISFCKQNIEKWQILSSWKTVVSFVIIQDFEKKQQHDVLTF